MLKVNDVELRIGERLLMKDVSFTVNSGDRIGLVGRNGAGKTTLFKVLSGQKAPTKGAVKSAGKLGYLLQNTEAQKPEQLALDRILDARNLSEITAKMRKLEKEMASENSEVMEQALEEYPKALEMFDKAGGYQAEAEAERIANGLGIDEEQLLSEIGNLSGGQRRRIELARILYSDADTLLLDEPTNHLDADSITWLKQYLTSFEGGFIMISHDIELIEELVNKVYFLDATRTCIDQYNMGWKKYLAQREMDDERRKTERAVAEKKASELIAQGNKMRAKATKAVAAQQMLKRAEKLLDNLEDVRQVDKVAALRFPPPLHCGKTPLTASNLAKSYGDKKVWRGIDLAIDKGSRVVVLGKNGAGKTTLLKVLVGEEKTDSGKVEPGYGLQLGYFAQEHNTIDDSVTLITNLERVAPNYNDTEIRNVLGSFGFSGDNTDKIAKVLSGGEKTRLALAMLVVTGANVLLLDEPTNNLDPASREEILKALRNFEGAIVLVSHDVGAVEALNPERVLLLPEGREDLWNESYVEMITYE